MKKRAFFLSLLCLIMIASSRERVSAACNDVESYGAITVTFPRLPSIGTYTIWTRMQVPDTVHNHYSLEINGNNCFGVGGSSITSGQWVWVAIHDGELGSKVSYNFSATTNNTAKLIGTERGVKIDRLLLVKSDCVPVADGSNCQSDSTAINASDLAGATQIPPLSAGPVRGLIIPSPTISQDREAVVKVVYSVDSKLIPSTNTYFLDTTLLSNGSHQVAIQIYKTIGPVINEATSIQVSNPQNAFSPFQRWARLNRHTAVIGSSVVGGFLLLLASLLIVRHIRLQKRLLEFKGF